MYSRKLTFVVVGSALVVVGVIATRFDSSLHANAAQGKDDKLKLLLKERHTTLETIVAELTAGQKAGIVPVMQVTEAQRAARKAEFDLCESDKERATVLAKMLDEAREHEKRVDTAFKAARQTHAAVLRATADRLEVEIALERVKAK